MTLFGLSAVILLVFVVKDILSICPESGCDCGKFCVNNNNRWCSNYNDTACSCKKGCLVYDQLMSDEEEKTIYCAECSCSYKHSGRYPVCLGEAFCIPGNLTLNVHYPATENESPNCPSTDSSTDYYDYYDYDSTTESTDLQ